MVESGSLFTLREYVTNFILELNVVRDSRGLGLIAGDFISREFPVPPDRTRMQQFLRFGPAGCWWLA